eukprot:710746_1
MSHICTLFIICCIKYGVRGVLNDSVSNIPSIHLCNAERKSDNYTSGQLSINIINPDADNGWNAGDYRPYKPGVGTSISNYNETNWVVFEFNQPVQVVQFAYRSKGDHAHDPKDMALRVNGLHGTEVLRFTGMNSTREWQFWQVFELSNNSVSVGRQWAWEIFTRYTPWQAYVQAVQFQIKTADGLIPSDFQASLEKDMKCKGNCR